MSVNLDDPHSTKVEYNDFETSHDRLYNAMVNYESDANNKLSYQEKLFSETISMQKSQLMNAGFEAYLKKLHACVEKNQILLEEVLKFTMSFVNETDSPEIPKPLQRRTLLHDNKRIDNMLSAIGNEWTHEGKAWRQRVWELPLKELSRVILNKSTRHSIDEEKVQSKM